MRRPKLAQLLRQHDPDIQPRRQRRYMHSWCIGVTTALLGWSIRRSSQDVIKEPRGAEFCHPTSHLSIPSSAWSLPQKSGAVLDQFCQREDILNSLYIVRMDMRGHGRSGKPLTSDGHLSSLYADDYKTVIEAYGLRKPIHVGWSLGGALAPDICAYLGPDTVSGLFYLSSMASVKHLWEGSATPFILEIFGRTTDPALMPQAMTEFVDACFMSDRHKPVPYSTRCLWYGMGASQPHACRVLNMQREQDTESLWRAVREGMPVCIVHGTGDVMIFPHALQDQMRAAGAKNLEVVLIPGAGHALTWEEPDTVAETLIRFSKDVWRGDKAKATKQSNL